MAKKTHNSIETTVSFFAFLAYVLTFANILQLVCLFISNFLNEDKSTQSGYSLIVFVWTVIWFIWLTTCGSQVTALELFIKNMNQEVISENFDKDPERLKEFEYMSLFNSCSNFEMRFTGYGMFTVDKKLFLTVTSIIISYGVLFASKLV
ncbi:uncharacterized protein TNIN_157611 [Trichonephila inaurata madagascariensis]|uniref:Uncharacterized protein n=1 Tax=Trichonephila inaurata madagascariensis TaxID=2747483 RepID=A0A8X7CJZ1_9ARAC|nr:uncharacterized protein TNIN_157611 [Trichonephila inaurata madagascariensis]